MHPHTCTHYLFDFVIGALFKALLVVFGSVLYEMDIRFIVLIFDQSHCKCTIKCTHKSFIETTKLQTSRLCLSVEYQILAKFTVREIMETCRDFGGHDFG